MTNGIAGKLITGVSIAGMLLASAPIAMAHERGDTSASSVQAEVKSDNGLHLGWFIGKHKGDDKDKDRFEHASSTASTTKHKRDRDDNDRPRVTGNVVGGVVTSVSGNTFVIGGKGTTTVTLASDAKVVGRDGATTTAAITAGTKVIAFGSTTATSTSGNSFTASVVIVFNQALGHLKNWLRF